jgi:ABC-type branched-subunit amino acid transport system permease subunit
MAPTVLAAISLPSYAFVLGGVLGLSTGLLAVGLVLIYRTNRVLNFAQGQLGVVAAILLAKFVTELHVPYWPSVVFCLAVAALVGAGSELLLRRLFNRPRLIVMVATIGLTQVLFVAALLPFVRPKQLFFNYPVPLHANFTVGGFPFHGDTVLSLIVAPLIVAALAVFFTRSPYGLAMRAMSENADSARLAGVWVRRTSTLAWAIAAVLSAVAAMLASPAKGNAFTQGLGPDLLLRALAAALIGGMTSMPVAFGAGIGIGIVETLLDINFHNNTASVEVAMFVLLLVVLLARVRSLRTGSREEERSSWLVAARTRRGVPDAARRQVRTAGLVTTLVVVVLLPAVVDQSRAFLASRMFLFAVVALSLTVLTGWAGQLSLGQFALVAVGALVAAHLTPGWPLPVVFVVAGLVAAVVAVVIGLPALRIKGLYLAVTTLGFALLMQVSIINTPCVRLPVTGWHVCSGLPDSSSTLLRTSNLFGISLGTQRALYFVALGQLVVFLVIARVWRDRGLQRVLVAVRDNEVAAGASGVRVVRIKLLAFALSGFMAGSAGVTYALVEQRVSGRLFDVGESILVVSMVVIGGLGSLEGALLGAAYLIGIPAAFGSGSTVQFITSGVGLLLFLLYLPGGLAGVLGSVADGLASALRSQRRPPRKPDPPGEEPPPEAPTTIEPTATPDDTLVESAT